MKNEELRKGKRCSYCNTTTELKVFKYGPVQHCPKCEAYVSLDRITKEPKGTLANATLRTLRMKAHLLSTDLIKRKVIKDGVDPEDAKEALYVWLSKEISLDFEFTSLAQLFDNETKEVIKIMEKYKK